MKNFFSGVHAALRLLHDKSRLLSSRSEPIGLLDEDDRPDECCGVCPPIAGGGYDCTCKGNPRCERTGQ